LQLNTPASIDTFCSFIQFVVTFLFVREGGDDILALVDISPFRFLAALHFFCIVLPNRILLLPFTKSLTRISTVIKDM